MSRRTVIAGAVGAAVLASAGVAGAVVGERPEPHPVPIPEHVVLPEAANVPELVPPAMDELGTTTTSSTTTTSTTVTSTTVTTVTTVTTEGVEEVEEVGEHPENHGLYVSQAAQRCPEGPEHGPCVAEVARSDQGKSTVDEEAGTARVDDPGRGRPEGVPTGPPTDRGPR